MERIFEGGKIMHATLSNSGSHVAFVFENNIVVTQSNLFQKNFPDSFRLDKNVYFRTGGKKAVFPDAKTLEGADRPTVAAARLALLLARERPSVLVAVGEGSLLDAAAAAAEAAEVRFARFAAGKPAHEAELDLGSEPATALDRLTGVAREIP